MTITFPLTAPTEPAPRTFDLDWVSASGISKSPYTGEMQSYTTRRLNWAASVEMPPMKDSTDGRKWHGFFVALDGKVGTFYMGLPDHAHPAGTERQNFQLASTADERARTISVQGMTADATLLRGDMMQISNRLYMVAEDMAADGSGLGTIKLSHGMRAVANGLTNVIVINPSGKWRMTSSSARRSTDQANIAYVSFAMEEAL